MSMVRTLVERSGIVLAEGEGTSLRFRRTASPLLFWVQGKLDALEAEGRGSHAVRMILDGGALSAQKVKVLNKSYVLIGGQNTGRSSLYDPSSGSWLLVCDEDLHARIHSRLASSAVAGLFIALL